MRAQVAGEKFGRQIDRLIVNRRSVDTRPSGHVALLRDIVRVGSGSIADEWSLRKMPA
jgi:hypothetical protein